MSRYWRRQPDGGPAAARLRPVVWAIALPLVVTLAASCITPYEKGESFYDAGQYSDAASKVREGLEERPDNPRLNLLMAKILVAQEKFRKAETYAQTAYDATPTRADGGRVLGKIHWELGRALKAVEVWDATRKQDPSLVPDEDYIRALEAAVETADSSHKYRKALELRKELADIDADHPEVAEAVMRRTRENLADQLVEGGNYQEAAQIYAELAASADGSKNYEYERGRLLLRLKKPDEARAAFDRYVDQGPASETLDRLLEVARRSRELNAPTVAVRYFRRAIDQLEGSATFRRAKLRLTLATLLFETKKGAEAREQLRKYLADMRELRGVPLGAEVYLTAADTASEAGRNGFSIDLLEKALTEAPPNWSIASRLAQQYAVQARQKEAERVLNEFIDRSDSTPDALKHAARWARERRNYDLAKHFYERLLETDPQRPDAWMELGKLYAELGQIEKMKHALETFVDKHGDDRHDLLDVAGLYTDQKLYEEAETVIEQVRRDNPKSLMVVDRLAELYRKWGKPERIHEAYRKWIEARGGKPSDYQLVGERLSRRRKLRQALPFLKEAAENGIADAWLQIADIYQKQRRELDMKKALDNYIGAASDRTRALRSALSRYRSTSLTRETTEILEELIEREPDVRSHYEQLGETYLSQGRRQAAFELWRTFVERSDNRIPTLRRVAGWFEQAGRPELIMEFYRHWLRGDAPDPALYRLMGDAYMKLAPQRWSRRRYPDTTRDDATSHARRYYQRYLEKADPSRTELEAFANSMRESDMWSTAAEAYGRIVEATSSGNKLRRHFAESLLHLGEAKRAKDLYREFYEARGKSPGDAQKIANRLFEFRYLESAEPYLEQMFSSDNGELVQAAFVKLAETYQHTGRTDRISGLVTDFLNRAPNPAKARQLAVQVLQRRGLYEEAANQIARVREFQGNVMGFDLGANLFRAGDTKRARKAFRRHAEESPYSSAVWLKVAEFLTAHARPDLARKAYNRSVKAAPDDFKPREARGRFRLLQGEVEKGMADFQGALDRASSKRRDAVRKTQVETLKSMGHFGRAATIARKTLSSANRHRGFFLKTTAEHALKTADKSRVNRIIQKLSSSSIALEDVVQIVVDTGHREAAAELIRNELDSGNFSAAGRAMVTRPDVFTHLGGVEALKRAARPLLKQGDAQSTLRAQIGEFFIRQGHYQEGIVYLRSAAEDGRPLFQTVLAQTYAKLGRTDQAIDLFQDHLANVSRAQQRQVLRRIGIRLELSGHPELFDNLLRNLVQDDDYAKAATGLLVESMARRGDLDDALGTVRRIRDSALAQSADGSGDGMLVDDTEAVERMLAALEGLAAAGYKQEAAGILEQLPADFRDHPDLDQFGFFLAAAIGGDSLEKRVDRAMEELERDDTRTARDRRATYARVLHRHGHFDLATKLIEPAVRSSDHESVESATRFLMRNAYSRGESQRIDELAGRFKETMSDDLRVLANVGNTLHDLGLDAQSLERLAPVARRASTSDNVRRALDVAQAAGDRKAASRLLDLYLRVAERPLSDLSDQHRRAIVRQDPTLASVLQKPYERTYPHRLEVRLRRARLAFRTGRVERGRQTLRRYLEEVDYEPVAVQRVLTFLDANDLWAEQTTLVLDQVDVESLTHRSLRHLGFAYANLRRDDRARSFFDRAIDEAPDGAEMATNLTRSLFDEGHTELAKAYGDRAVELRPARPAAKLYRGLAHLAAGEDEAADQDLEVGLEAGINRLYTLFQAGRAALNADRADLAGKFLLDLAETPNSSDYGILMPTRLALDAYADSGHAKQGVDFLETHFPDVAAGRTTSSQDLLRNISGLYERAGMHDRAYSVYRDALDRQLAYAADSSPVPVYMNNLAYTYSTTNNHLDEGFRLARRAVAGAPSRTPSYLDTLGWLHYRAGDLDRAEADVRRALRTSGGTGSALAELYEHLAEIREARGFDGEAYWMRRFYKSLE